MKISWTDDFTDKIKTPKSLFFCFLFFGFVTVGAPLIFYNLYYKEKKHLKENIKYKCPDNYVCKISKDCYTKECNNCCIKEETHKTSQDLRIAFFLIFCYGLFLFVVWCCKNENENKNKNQL